jgi:flagellar motor switch protein FliN/FliY
MSYKEPDAGLRAANEASIESWRDYLDLSVPLVIELGRTRLSVREILELEAHGIIQLSRSTGEGVDVKTDDRQLARGEILMIEDRTGVRINDIIVEEE